METGDPIRDPRGVLFPCGCIFVPIRGKSVTDGTRETRERTGDRGDLSPIPSDRGNSYRVPETPRETASPLHPPPSPVRFPLCTIGDRPSIERPERISIPFRLYIQTYKGEESNRMETASGNYRITVLPISGGSLDGRPGDPSSIPSERGDPSETGEDREGTR